MRKNRRVVIYAALIAISLMLLALVIGFMSSTHVPSIDEISDWVNMYVTVGETTPDQFQQIISSEFQDWNCDSEEQALLTLETKDSSVQRGVIRCSKQYPNFDGANLYERLSNYLGTFKLCIIDFEFQRGILDNVEIGIALAP